MGLMDRSYLSIGTGLWSQLGRMITGKRFSRKWSNEQTQSLAGISFSFDWTLLSYLQMKSQV